MLLPKKSLVPRKGVPPFQPPVMTAPPPKYAFTSQNVMSKLDDLIGAYGGENCEKTLIRDVDGSRNEIHDEAHSDIPKFSRLNAGDFKTAKLKLLEDSATNSTALPHGISDDSAGKPTDAYRDPTKPMKATGSTINQLTDLEKNPRLKHLNQEMVDTILSNKVDVSKMLASRDQDADYFDGFVGLESVENVLKEMFIVPMLHPEM